jgi:diguanylate cyclase (GGDEF)-like protein
LLSSSQARPAKLPEKERTFCARKLENCPYFTKTLGRISLSIGISAYPGNGKTAEELVRKADEELYRAKTEGRDRVVMAESP